MVRVISRAHHDEAEISLPDVDLPRTYSEMKRPPDERWLALGTVGVPHLVVRVDDVEHADVLGRGPPSIGPSSRAGRSERELHQPLRRWCPWLIRTFERGVEGETLACGTGTVAAALALARGLRPHSR